MAKRNAYGALLRLPDGADGLHVLLTCCNRRSHEGHCYFICWRVCKIWKSD